MEKFMRAIRKAKRQDGFTLVELMVVVVIIGILVAIAIPIFNSVQRNAADRAHDANRRVITGAMTMWVSENVGTASTWGKATATDQWAPFLDAWPDVPKNRTGAVANEEYTASVDAAGKITVLPAGSVTTP